MSLRTGSQLGPYRLLRDFVAGGNCRGTFAESGGREFFVKEFQRPKYPPGDLAGGLLGARVARCRAFEDRHRRLLEAIRRASDATGAMVAPVEFFRHGLAYYHVAPRIAPQTLAPGEVGSRGPRERLQIIRDLARAVAGLHRVRVVHGDLKPSNILLDPAMDGTAIPRLIDFDGAYFAGEVPDPDDMEFDQAYMAPELLAYVQQSAGVASVRPGLAADVFSLGLLLHECWAGCPASPAGNHQYAAEAVRSGDGLLFRTHDLDGALAVLMRRALSADPAARPMATEIEAAAAAASNRLGSLRPAEPQALFGSADVPSPAARAPSPLRPGAAEFGLGGPMPTTRSGSFGVQIRKSRNLERDGS